jgi:GH24 family phage-related lysozyme (muramidase)
MKQIFGSLLLVLCVMPAFANDDAAIANIRQAYEQTHNNLCKFKTTEFDAGVNSSEGVEAKAFRDKDGQIKLIKTIIYGEMGKNTREYYYANNQLIFVLDSNQTYNAPMYLDDVQAKAAGVAPFDPTKTTTTENRYYFKNNQLIRWLDPQKKAIASNTSNYQLQAKTLLADSNRLMRKQTFKH